MGISVHEGDVVVVRSGIFLDRDGVINRAIIRNGKPYAPDSIDSFEFLPGVLEAVTSLRAAEFCIIVITNQPDVGAGRQTKSTVEAMHDHLRATLDVDDIRVCYHIDADKCECRKPKPGMILDAAHHWNIDLTRSVLVGDRWRDIEAGKAAGCRTILVGKNYDERQARGYDAAVTSLLDASHLILSGPINSTEMK